MRSVIILFLLLVISLTPGNPVAAECDAGNRACIIGVLLETAGQIGKPSWRDQIYREIAKTLTFDGEIDRAIGLIQKIETPDTKAMTIRGIGMEAAKSHLDQEEYNRIFIKLRVEADKIEHPPSYAIALTYIAMSQAFAGDNDGAWKTASEMNNQALRHKAYGETAEIQADNGNFTAAVKSISFISSAAFKNKAYSNISKILTDRENFPEALKASLAITNPYKKAKAMQYILDAQKPREAPD